MAPGDDAQGGILPGAHAGGVAAARQERAAVGQVDVEVARLLGPKIAERVISQLKKEEKEEKEERAERVEREEIQP